MSRRDHWLDLFSRAVHVARIRSFVAWQRLITRTRTEHMQTQLPPPPAASGSIARRLAPMFTRTAASPATRGQPARKAVPPAVPRRPKPPTRWRDFTRRIRLAPLAGAQAGLYIGWRRLGLRIVTQIHIDEFHSIRQAAAAAAVGFVNQVLAEQRCAPVAKLADLARYRDVPCEPIRAYQDDREAVSFMVSRLLLNVHVPARVRAEPEFVDEVRQSDLVEIVSYIDLDGALEFIGPRKVSHLSSMTVGGRRFHVSNRYVDNMLGQLLQGIRFPLESNAVDRRVVSEVLGQLQLSDLVSIQPIVGTLSYYQVIDDALFLDRDTCQAAVDAVMKFELPLISNKLVEPWMIEAIVADSTLLSDWVESVCRLSIAAIDRLTITDRNYVANIASFEDEWPFIGRFPFVPNVCPAQDITEIASVLDKFYDIIPSLPVTGLSLFDHYATVDERFYGALTGQEYVWQMYDEIVLPLGSNSAVDIIDEIITVLKLGSLAEFVPAATDIIDQFAPKSSEYYGNQQIVDSVFEWLLSETGFPVCANQITDDLVTEIVDARELTEILSEMSELKPLRNFELADTLLYTSEATTANVIDSILVEFDDELPICRNETQPGIVAEIVEGLDCCDCPDWLELSAFNSVIPSERRIDLDSSPIAVSVLNGATDHLPIETTRDFCADATIDEIVSRIQPLSYFEFSMTDTIHLQVYEAPDEVEESLDRVVAMLMDMVLQTDVLPFLPAWADVETSELDAIVSPIVSEVRLERVAAFRIDPLSDLKRREVPPTVTANMLVQRLLWQFVLPDCPVRSRDIDDLLDALGPGQDPRMGSEEPLPEEAAAMLSSFRPKAGLP
jgi:hypothetical protein